MRRKNQTGALNPACPAMALPPNCTALCKKHQLKRSAPKVDELAVHTGHQYFRFDQFCASWHLRDFGSKLSEGGCPKRNSLSASFGMALPRQCPAPEPEYCPVPICFGLQRYSKSPSQVGSWGFCSMCGQHICKDCEEAFSHGPWHEWRLYQRYSYIIWIICFWYDFSFLNIHSSHKRKQLMGNHHSRVWVVSCSSLLTVQTGLLLVCFKLSCLCLCRSGGVIVASLLLLRRLSNLHGLGSCAQLALKKGCHGFKRQLHKRFVSTSGHIVHIGKIVLRVSWCHARAFIRFVSK